MKGWMDVNNFFRRLEKTCRKPQCDQIVQCKLYCCMGHIENEEENVSHQKISIWIYALQG